MGGLMHIIKTTLFLSLIAVSGFSPNSFGTDFDLNQLLKLVPGTQKPEEVIAKLPPEVRARFVLMLKSRSAQEASAENPRALLYNEAGTFWVSFNGSKEQRGFEALELMQYDPRTKDYEFREILYRNGQAEISEPNPSACLVCHQRNPRANWEPYPYWPGALGQTYRFSKAEIQKIYAFAQSAASHPRYRHLDFATHFKRHLQGKNETPAFETYQLLNRQVLDRVPMKIRQLPEYGQFRFAIFGALANCADLEGFVPLEQLDPLPHLTYPNVSSDMERRFARLPLIYRRFLRPQTKGATIKLRYLFENLGIVLQEFTNSFSEKYFLSSTGTLFPYLIRQLYYLDPTLKGLKVPFAALRDYYSLTPFPSEPKYQKQYDDFCTELKWRSLKQFP